MITMKYNMARASLITNHNAYDVQFKGGYRSRECHPLRGLKMLTQSNFSHQHNAWVTFLILVKFG